MTHDERFAAMYAAQRMLFPSSAGETDIEQLQSRADYRFARKADFRPDSQRPHFIYDYQLRSTAATSLTFADNIRLLKQFGGEHVKTLNDTYEMWALKGPRNNRESLAAITRLNTGTAITRVARVSKHCIVF